MTRSAGSIMRDIAFISVVLPEPVPPEMMTLRRARPEISRMRATCGVQLPWATRRAKSIFRLVNLRIET